MAKITFLKYYKMQFKDVPKIWKLAKINKAWGAFILTMLTLFNPFVIHCMWLYDTGRMSVDKRFMEDE